MREVEEEGWVDEETGGDEQGVVGASVVWEAQPQSLFVDVAEQQLGVIVQSVEFRVRNRDKEWSVGLGIRVSIKTESGGIRARGEDKGEGEYNRKIEEEFELIKGGACQWDGE